MAAESYDYFLRLLKLPRSASEQDILGAISNERRVLNRRMNAPVLEVRQEAERKAKALEDAENLLLGPEGKIIRSRIEGDQSACTTEDLSVDAEAVARAIERVALARGTKAQERKGTVLYRRAMVFYRGIDYMFEELVHKQYAAAENRKRCAAIHNGLSLFEWYYETGLNPEHGKTSAYIQGPWVADTRLIRCRVR